MMRVVTASYQIAIDELASGWATIALSVGPEADPIALSVQRAGRRLKRFQVHHRTERSSIVVMLPDTRETFDLVQPLGPDRVLLVRRRIKSNSDENAHIYDMGGQLVAAFQAGDGIEDVQTTEDGQIWVSYFDEGIFGSLELGQSGVVCLDQSGRSVLRYNQMSGPESPISECYAMNVASSREVWLYYYTEFPLVRLLDRRFDHEWKGIPVQGARGFAVDGEHAVFAGSYESSDRLFLVSLNSMHMEELQPVDGDGKELKFRRAFGRGPRLFLETEQALFMLKLGDIHAQHGQKSKI